MKTEALIANLPDNVAAAIAVFDGREGRPREDDWGAIAAGEDLVKFIKELQASVQSAEVAKPDPNGNPMPFYIGVKRLQARPMSLGDYNAIRGWTTPANEDPASPGYLVVSEGGHRSWSPKHAFESDCMRLNDVAGKSITGEDVASFISRVEVIHETDRMVVCQITLANGFTFVESSACADASNFNADLGAQLCVNQASQKVWHHLGFLLRTAIAGFKSGAK